MYSLTKFNNSKFDNLFVELENQDYKIQASQDEINKIYKEDDMRNTRKKASYISEISSGYDATTQNDYDTNASKSGQIGKDHEEEVALENNWTDDKRDAVGRAASIKALRRTAAKLNKFADAMENGEDDEYFEDEILNEDDSFEDDLDDLDDDDDDEEYEELIEEVASSLNTKEASTSKEAMNHPIDKGDDSPKSEMPSDTGDEWIDIGPGEFDDKRDEVGKAGDND